MELNLYIGNKIREIRLRKGMTQDELAEKMNTTRQTISRYETGDRKANQDMLFMLSEIFGVSIDDFFPPKNGKTNILTIYSQLQPTRQKKVYSFAEKQLEEQNKVFQLEEYVDLKIYSTLSAGTGIVDLDPDHVDIISYKGYIPEHDMAFRVSGKSMEPVFEDGEIIFVEKTHELRNGQFGVVLVNGEGYIKKVYFEDNRLRLVSLNKEFDDIYADGKDEVVIVGRVIL